MSIEDFLQTGLLEVYALGAATPEETELVEKMLAAHPEVRRELDTISLSLEAYAQAQAVEPKATVKPLVMATINYLERLQNGEPVTEPPALTPTSKIADYQEWLNRPDMALPPDADAIYALIIGATPAATTAIAWLTGTAENEIHDHEYERFLIIEGSCDIITDQAIYHLSAGDYHGIPLHVKHAVKVTSAIPCKVVLQRVSAV